MTQPIWTYDLTEKYKDNLKNFESYFPEAYKFLKDIEGLGDMGFHMGTAVNMHFYYRENFLFYFVFHPRTRSGNFLKFSSEYNLRLKSDAPVPAPELFFKPLVEMLNSSNLLDEEQVEIEMKLDKSGNQAYRIYVYPFESSKVFFEYCMEVLNKIGGK